MPARIEQPLAVIVGANMAAIRQKRGLTQAELARQLGVTPDQLSRSERGFVAPRFNRLEKICEILHCAPAELFATSDVEGAPSCPMSRDSEILYLAERLVKLLRQSPLQKSGEQKPEVASAPRRKRPQRLVKSGRK